MANDSSLLRLIWHRVGPLNFMWLLLLFWIVPIVNHSLQRVEFAFLVVLTAFQLLETTQVLPSMNWLKLLWNVLRLLLCYLLIGFTGGTNSPYYILLFWPIVSAAMDLKPLVTALFTVLTVGSYISFLFFVQWATSYISSHGFQVLILKSMALAIAACAVSVTVRANGQRHLNA